MASLRSLAAIAFVSSISLTAQAGPAWTAAKANLPKETAVLVGLDLAQLQKSSLFSLGFPMLLSQQPALKEGLDLIKTTCKLDPMKVVKDVVVGADENQKHGAIFITVDGLDQAKLVTCLEAVAVAKGKKDKVVVKTEGKITELAVGDKPMFLTWIGTNVIVVPHEFTSKADLQAWTGAKTLAKSKVAKGMGKVNTSAAVWAVSGMPKDIDDKTKMKMAYGAFTLSGGKFGADLHVQVASAESAKAVAEKAQKELTAFAAGDSLDANLKAVLTAVTVKAAGDEVHITGSIPETDVLQLAGALMR